MSRRSAQLQSQGYYGNEGLPIVCYKETLVSCRRCLSSSSLSCRSEFKSNLEKHNTSDNNIDNNIITNMDSSSRHMYSNTFRDSYRNDDSNTSSNRHRNSRFSSIFNRRIFDLLFVLCFGFARREECREEILRLNKVLNSLQPVTDTMPNFALESLVNTFREEILRINKVLNSLQLVADTMPNFAQESQGNTCREEMLRLNKVLNSLQPVADTMPNFSLDSRQKFYLIGLHKRTPNEEAAPIFLNLFCKRPVHPRIVIQGSSPPAVGRCWSFEGGQGHLFIALSHPVYISHVTLGHVSKNLSPTGTIPSAPKTFSVYGMNTLDDKGTYLGTSLFDQDGDATQTFELPDHGKGVFKYVKQSHNITSLFIHRWF